jgi:hypothetical protein
MVGTPPPAPPPAAGAAAATAAAGVSRSPLRALSPSRGRSRGRRSGGEVVVRETIVRDSGGDSSTSYPDWTNSVEIAMQDAIARICHKYQQGISTMSPYYYFGERSADDTPIDRSDEEYHPVYRSYRAEREFISANTEMLLKKQVVVMDDARETLKQCNTRIMQAETPAIFVDDKRKALEERLKLLEELKKMEEKMTEIETWISMLEPVVLHLAKC